jgi:hypothetical protein
MHFYLVNSHNQIVSDQVLINSLLIEQVFCSFNDVLNSILTLFLSQPGSLITTRNWETFLTKMWPLLGTSPTKIAPLIGHRPCQSFLATFFSCPRAPASTRQLTFDFRHNIQFLWTSSKGLTFNSSEPALKLLIHGITLGERESCNTTKFCCSWPLNASPALLYTMHLMPLAIVHCFQLSSWLDVQLGSFPGLLKF